MLTFAFVAMVKVTGSLQKSTEIMKLSNDLIKLPKISATMREMSMEMTKVNIVFFFATLILIVSLGWYYGGNVGRYTGYGR